MAGGFVPHAPTDPSPALLATLQGNPALTVTRATPAGAFKLARRHFLEGRRLDMQGLASELGVSRATLYRWCGQRERLLGDVIWSLSDQVFKRACQRHGDHSGQQRILAVFREHVGAIVASEPLRAFLRQETHTALRILTSSAGSVQPRVIESFLGLLAEEVGAGSFEPKTDLYTLSYAVVRVTEGFIYNDAIADLRPEVERAARVVELLLD
jgi:AcrR family transcriptional regulator